MTSHTIWRHKLRRFAIPDDVDLPPGDLVLRHGAQRRTVDPGAAAPYEIPAEQVREQGRARITEAVETLRRQAQAWLDAHPDEHGPGRRMVESFLAPFQTRTGAPPDQVASAIAEAIEKLANDPSNDASAAELRKRIAAARSRHLENNPDMAEAVAALERALEAATPELASRLSSAARSIASAVERLRESKRPSRSASAADGEPDGGDERKD